MHIKIVPWINKCYIRSIEQSSAESDDEVPVHLSVGVSEQDIREAALQHVLAQERRLLHNLSGLGLKVLNLEFLHIFILINKSP